MIRIYRYTKESMFVYRVQLSPMSPASKTFAGVPIKDAASSVSNLFGKHRSLVKLIQAYKKRQPTTITTERLVPLLAELLQLQDSFVLECDEDIVNFTSRYKNLREVAHFLQTHHTSHTTTSTKLYRD